MLSALVHIAEVLKTDVPCSVLNYFAVPVLSSAQLRCVGRPCRNCVLTGSGGSMRGRSLGRGLRWGSIVGSCIVSIIAPGRGVPVRDTGRVVLGYRCQH